MVHPAALSNERIYSIVTTKNGSSIDSSGSGARGTLNINLIVNISLWHIFFESAFSGFMFNNLLLTLVSHHHPHFYICICCNLNNTKSPYLLSNHSQMRFWLEGIKNSHIKYVLISKMILSGFFLKKKWDLQYKRNNRTAINNDSINFKQLQYICFMRIQRFIFVLVVLWKNVLKAISAISNIIGFSAGTLLLNQWRNVQISNNQYAIFGIGFSIGIN